MKAGKQLQRGKGRKAAAALLSKSRQILQALIQGPMCLKVFGMTSMFKQISIMLDAPHQLTTRQQDLSHDSQGFQAWV